MKYILPLLLLFSAHAFAQEHFMVYFDFNEEQPNAPSAEALKQWTDANTNAKVIAIHGFADAADNNDYNHKLSSQRIAAVAGILKEAGIAFADEAVMKPYGESEATGNAETDRKVVVYYVPQVLEIRPAEEKIVPRQPLSASLFTPGNRIILKGLLFYPDTEMIVPSSIGVLEELAQIMIANPGLKISIHGHMCCSGYDRTNLSGDRAKMVYKYLISKEIKKKRMKHQGFGTTRPVHNIPEKNEEERLANRRVEIEVIEN